MIADADQAATSPWAGRYVRGEGEFRAELRRFGWELWLDLAHVGALLLCGVVTWRLAVCDAKLIT